MRKTEIIMAWRIVLLCLCFLLSGFKQNPLESLVNASFPPVNTASQRQTAVNSNVDALSHLPAPNLAVAIILADAQKILASKLKALGVTALKLQGDQGLLLVQATFDSTFTGQDAPHDPSLASTLDKLKPHVVGNVTLYAGVSGAIAADAAAPALVVNLLPALSTIRVSKIEVDNSIDSKTAASALTSLLNHYKDKISGALTEASFSHVKVPALSTKPDDISRKLQSADHDATVQINATPIDAPFRLAGLAWLVTPTQLEVMAQLVPTADKTALPTIAVDHSYAGVNKRFEEVIDQVFQVKNADQRTWVAIRKDVVAVGVNTVLAQAAACVTAQGSIPTQHISAKIPMPNGVGVNCSINTSCPAKRDCTFHAKPATGDCSTCIFRTPRVCDKVLHTGCAGGQCTQRGQDPTCLAAKAAQQAINDANETARVADCTRLNGQDVAACQAKVASDTALCVAKKQALDKL